MAIKNDAERDAWRAQLAEKFKSIFPDGIPQEEWVPKEESIIASPDDTFEYLTDIVDDISGNIMVQGIAVPKYGLPSMKARSVPMYVYGADCKPFMEISNTGFSDGRYIFVSSLWLRHLAASEEKSGDMATTPWVMHHLMHLLRNHTRRLTNFEPDIAEKAKDMSINMDIQQAYGREWAGATQEGKNMVFNKVLFSEPGFDKKDIERFNGKAEETIARVLASEKAAEKLNSQINQQPGNGQPQPGNGQPQPGNGQPQPGNGQPQPGNGQPQPGNGQPQPGNGQPQGQQKSGKGGKQDGSGNNGPWDPAHSIPMEDFAKVLEKNSDLTSLKDTLGIPDSDDLDGIGEIEEKSRLKDRQDIQKAMEQKAALGGKYPGGHIVDSEAERVKASHEGKLNFKLGIRQFIAGQGRQYQETYETPGILSFVEGSDMGLGDQEAIYMPEMIPAQPDAVGIVLLDTSGSVDPVLLGKFLTEVMWLKRNNGEGDTASEIHVYSADTCLRGEPEQITEENMDEMISKGVQVYGRGGTDFSTPLKQLMGTKIMKERKIAFVLYFTDLCASIPKKQDFPADIPVAFICTPNDYSIEFARGVKDWAPVYAIEDGVEVDLTEDGFNKGPVDKRSGKGRKV
jgi:hypothetical protein